MKCKLKLLEGNIRENTTLSLDTHPKTSMKEKHCKLELIGGSDGKESACNARYLGWEDTLEEGIPAHSSILAWRIPIDRGTWRASVPSTEEPGGLQSMGVTKTQMQLSD